MNFYGRIGIVWSVFLFGFLAGGQHFVLGQNDQFEFIPRVMELKILEKAEFLIDLHWETRLKTSYAKIEERVAKKFNASTDRRSKWFLRELDSMLKLKNAGGDLFEKKSQKESQQQESSLSSSQQEKQSPTYDTNLVSEPSSPMFVEVLPDDTGTLNIRSGPGLDFDKIGSFYAGQRVEVDELYPEWLGVSISGRTGRIYAPLVGQVDSLVKPPLYSGTDLSFKKEFLNNHRSSVLTKDKELNTACLNYYDEVDQIARQEDFPTALVLAMWEREFSCRLENPGNGRGMFQIITTSKPAGPVSVAELQRQVREFIEFSRGKRAYYDNVQKFDTIPVTISYNSYDLLSIRKHAILYNGLYSGITPTNSNYTNHNFAGSSSGSRDGIIVTFLKVLKWEVER